MVCPFYDISSCIPPLQLDLHNARVTHPGPRCTQMFFIYLYLYLGLRLITDDIAEYTSFHVRRCCR